jgi:WD40 repeat protein
MKNHAEQHLRYQLGMPPITVEHNRESTLTDIVVYPILLVTYRAHLRPITSISYVHDRQLVVTGSIDCTIRLFTLTGRYIGFFSQTLAWEPLSTMIVSKESVYFGNIRSSILKMIDI